MPKTIGIIRGSGDEVQVEWSIPNFFSLPQRLDESYESPQFQFLGEYWYLTICPNGESRHNSKGYIALYLYRKHIYQPVTIACSLGLKIADGKTRVVYNFTNVYDKIEGFGNPNLLKRAELYEKKATLAPSGGLTIFCSVRKHVPKSVLRIEELSRDLGLLLIEETNSDIVVRVEEEDFRLLKSVLGARSPVFAAMFRHETRETISGVVPISDCSVDTFHTFARYLYTGKVDELSPANVFDLFRVADKYLVKDLADDCVDYMRNTLSVDTFCDTVQVALDHEDELLMDKITYMMTDQMEEILETEQWKSFLLENPLRANKLFGKAFANIKKHK